MSDLRLVTDDIEAPLTHDDALTHLNEHWKVARAAYAEAIGSLGDHYLRHLIIPPARRSITRSHMVAIRNQARMLARHATRMADALDQAVGVYDRAQP